MLALTDHPNQRRNVTGGVVVLPAVPGDQE